MVDHINILLRRILLRIRLLLQVYLCTCIAVMYEAAAQTQQPCLVVMQVLEERLQASCQASTAKVVAECTVRAVVRAKDQGF